MIPRACSHIFEHILKDCSDTEWEVQWFAFLPFPSLSSLFSLFSFLFSLFSFLFSLFSFFFFLLSSLFSLLSSLFSLLSSLFSLLSSLFSYPLLSSSFLEIYKEVVKDLINIGEALKVRQTAQRGVWIEGLSQHYVTCEVIF